MSTVKVVRVITLCSIILAVCPATSLAIQCYECVSTINAENLESGTNCSQLTGIVLSTTNYTSCSTQYGRTIEGSTRISRSGSFQEAENICTGTVCTCNTDRCNNQAITIPNSLECYECQSSDFFDNGCGGVLNGASPYVHTVSGCSACGKTITTGTDYVTRYSRSCSRSISNENSCYSTGPLDMCVCQAALCNSAHKFQSIVSPSILCVLISVLKIYY